MNEKRMKTSVNTGEVSLPAAQEAGRGVKVRAEQGGGSENRVLALKKGLIPRAVVIK
jgi:hypothetical protein